MTDFKYSQAHKVTALVPVGQDLRKHYQLEDSKSSSHFVTVTYNGTPSSTAFQNQSCVDFTFDPKSIVGSLKRLFLRYTITNSDASNHMKLMPSPYFCSRIEWWTADGTTHIYTQYPDTDFWSACVLTDKNDITEDWRDQMNVSPGFYISHKQHKLSASRTYRLPIMIHPFVTCHENLRLHVGSIKLKMYIQASEVSGNDNDAVISELALEAEVEKHAKSLENQVHGLKNKHKHIYRYCEPFKLESSAQTLTASTQYLFNLDTVTGDCPFLLFIIRSSTSVGNQLKTTDLGPTATVDLLNANGQSMSGWGTAVRLDLLKSFILPKHLQNPSFVEQRNFYVLPFCNSVSAALAGSRAGGYIHLNGSAIKLAITPSAAGVSAVQTITLTNTANDGGAYQLHWRGETTDDLAYNTSAANIKVALEAMTGFLDYNGGQPLTVTASAAATATFTLTFAANMRPPNDEKDQVRLVATTLKQSSTGDISATGTSTLGNAGFTTGSYTITVYPFIFKNLLSKAGMYKSELDIA